jgi:hypothetical protein
MTGDDRTFSVDAPAASPMIDETIVPQGRKLCSQFRPYKSPSVGRSIFQQCTSETQNIMRQVATSSLVWWTSALSLGRRAPQFIGEHMRIDRAARLALFVVLLATVVGCGVPNTNPPASAQQPLSKIRAAPGDWDDSTARYSWPYM